MNLWYISYNIINSFWNKNRIQYFVLFILLYNVFIYMIGMMRLFNCLTCLLICVFVIFIFTLICHSRSDTIVKGAVRWQDTTPRLAGLSEWVCVHKEAPQLRHSLSVAIMHCKHQGRKFQHPPTTWAHYVYLGPSKAIQLQGKKWPNIMIIKPLH